MKTLRPLLLGFSLFGLLMMGVNGQETEKKVHLKVVKGGETTVDTVFSAADLKDEDLHMKISELAGVDIEMMEGGKMSMHASHTGDHNFAYVTVDDSEKSEGHVKKKIVIKKGGEGEETKDIYFYSTDGDVEMGEHTFVMKGDSGSWTEKDGNVMVVTSGSGKNVWVTKEGEEGESTKVIVKHVGEGEEGSEEMIFIKDGKEIQSKGKGEYYIIEKIDKDHKGDVKVVKVKKGEGDTEEITVTVGTGNELHMGHGDKGDTHVFVSEGKSGTVIVSKDVEISKSIGEDGEIIEITVIIDEGEKEEEKVKEKSKETKQKKDKERNKK